MALPILGPLRVEMHGPKMARLYRIASESALTAKGLSAIQAFVWFPLKVQSTGDETGNDVTADPCRELMRQPPPRLYAVSGCHHATGRRPGRQAFASTREPGDRPRNGCLHPTHETTDGVCR